MEGNAAVISPQIVVVGKRRYRRTAGDSGAGREGGGHDASAGFDEDFELGDQDDGEMPEFIQALDGGGFSTTIEVPESCMGKLIGKKGAHKNQLETETGTKVLLPKRGSGSEVVTVTGDKARGVESARTRIELLIDSASRNSRPTHFICIPLLGKPFEEALPAFQERALEINPTLGSEMFTEPATLHLTLGVLKLMTKSAIRDAIALLDRSVEAAAATAFAGSKGTPTVVVRGVEYMNDDPGAVDVLYGKVGLRDGSDGLQRFADEVAGAFVAAGLLDDEGRGSVKLHATLINSKKRRDDNQGGGRASRKRESFDAVKVLKAYNKHEFGSVELKEVHLSRLAAREGGGFYTAEHVSFVKS